MSEAISFKDLLTHGGYDTIEAQYAAIQYLCAKGIISRPDRTNVSVEKIKTIRDLLDSHFIKLCDDHVCKTVIVVFANFKNKKIDFNIGNIVTIKMKDYCDICRGQHTKREANECMSAIENNDVLYNILVLGGEKKQHREIQECLDNKFVEPNLEFKYLVGSKHNKALNKQSISHGRWACKVIVWNDQIEKGHARSSPIMTSPKLRGKIIYCSGGIVSVFRKLKENISMGGLFRYQ